MYFGYILFDGVPVLAFARIPGVDGVDKYYGFTLTYSIITRGNNSHTYLRAILS